VGRSRECLEYAGYSGAQIINGFDDSPLSEEEIAEVLADYSDDDLEELANGVVPLTFIPSNEVREIARGFASLTEGELRSRFDPQALEERGAYPPDAWGGAEDIEGWIVGSALEVIELFTLASLNDFGIVSSFSL
jgi:hypothetical protein